MDIPPPPTAPRQFPPEPPSTSIDNIAEITQIIRTLTFYYTENISQHNRIIQSYNQNIASLLGILHNISDIQNSRSANQNVYPRENRQNSHRRNRGVAINRNSDL